MLPDRDWCGLDADSAEGNLYNVVLFMPLQTSSTLDGLHPPHAYLMLGYLDIVSSLKGAYSWWNQGTLDQVVAACALMWDGLVECP